MVQGPYWGARGFRGLGWPKALKKMGWPNFGMQGSMALGPRR